MFDRKVFLLVLIFLCSFKLNGYEKELAICAIFQNEAPYLKEWIEFHKLQGVQHFYLFNNNSRDRPKLILNKYIKKGEVTLIYWPLVGQSLAQYKAYNHCLQLTAGKVKWVAYLDTDEFLFLPSGKNLQEFLKGFENLKGVAGVCANWQMFGTSGVKNLGERELMIENLYLKGPREYPENVHVKTIVRPEYAIRQDSPHCFLYKKSYFCVDSNFKPISGPFNPDIPIDEIRINHYFCRTLDFAYGEKFQRLKRCNGWSDEALLERIETFDKNCSVEEDLSIQIYAERLREAMGF